MTTRKTTKKALLGSLLALVLCFSMLVGTTFAWFTDSEYIQGNQIKAGTLDIELGDETPLFSFDKDINWEPGFARAVSTVLENKGTLALKYKLSIINVEEVDGGYDNKTQTYGNLDGSRLAEVLEVYVGKVVDEDAYLGTLADLMAADSFAIELPYTDDQKVLLPGKSAPIDLVVKMKEEAGNEYMADSITFDIAIVATQYTYEADSFGNQYDANALYPEVAPIVGVDGQEINNVKIDLDDYYGADNLNAKAAIEVEAGNAVTINGGHFDGGTTPFGGAGNMAVWANGKRAKVTINDGYFTNTGLAKDDEGNLDVGHIDLIYASDDAYIRINGGFFVGADDTVWLVNCQDNSGAKIEIYGGTFVNWNPKTEVTAPAGTTEIKVFGTVTEEVQDNGDIWYTVG